MKQHFDLIPGELQARIETASKLIMAARTRDLAGLIVYVHEKVAEKMGENGETTDLEKNVMGSLGLSVMSYGQIITELHAEVQSLKVQNSNLRNMIE